MSFPEADGKTFIYFFIIVTIVSRRVSHAKERKCGDAFISRKCASYLISNVLLHMHTQGVVTQKGLMTVPRGDIAPLLAHMIASLMHIREASLSSNFITGPCMQKTSREKCEQWKIKGEK